MGKLEGRVAVVTGGSSGIGLATARLFRDEGAHVVITGRNAETLAQAAGDLGEGVVAILADVTQFNDLDNLVGSLQAQFGGVDVLFVNAGIAKMGPIQDVTETVFDEVMATNFKGAFFTIQKLLPVLREDASVIINGSVNAHVGFAGSSVYSASKAAVHSLARTLSIELVGRKIRVNVLNTGPVQTSLYGKLGLPPEVVQGFAQSIIGKLPVSRFGLSEEVAKAALFLASADSSFILGSEITVDGGLSINSL